MARTSTTGKTNNNEYDVSADVWNAHVADYVSQSDAAAQTVASDVTLSGAITFSSTTSGIDHTALSNKGSNTHSQIDTAVTNSTNHIAATNNPHTTTDANLSTSDITTNNSSTSKHGFLKKLDNDVTHFLRGDATWAVPAGASGAPGPYTFYIKLNGVDAEAYSSTGTLVYGGAADAGGVDGADHYEVIDACVTAIEALPDGSIVFAADSFTIDTQITIAENTNIAIWGTCSRTDIASAGGSDGSRLYFTGAGYAIKYDGTDGAETGSVDIRNLMIGVPGTQSGINITGAACFYLENIHFYSFQELSDGSAQIAFYAYAGTPEDAAIRYCRATDVQVGFQIEYPTVHLDNCFVVQCNYGFLATTDYAIWQTYTQCSVEDVQEYGFRLRYASGTTIINPCVVDLDAGGSYAYNLNYQASAGQEFVLINPYFNGANSKLISIGGGLYEMIGHDFKRRGSSTGTGAEQTIAHGLAGTPTVVLLSPAASNAVQTSGADSTNIYVTADNAETWYYYVEYQP